MSVPSAMWRRLSVVLAIAAAAILLIAGAGWLWGDAYGQPNLPAGQIDCPTEAAQLRYLVQLYASARTETEFALARTETERQRLERRVKELENAMRQVVPK